MAPDEGNEGGGREGPQPSPAEQQPNTTPPAEAPAGDPPAEETPREFFNPRRAAMDAAIANRKRMVEAEIKEDFPADPEAPADERRSDEIPAEPIADERPTSAAPASDPERRTFRIGGRDVALTEDEIQDAIRRQYAEDRGVPVAPVHRAPVQTPAAEPDQTPRAENAPAADGGLSDDDLRAVAHDIQYGDETSAVKSLKKIVDLARGAGNVDEVVERKLRASRAKTSFEDDLKAVSSAHKEIFENEDLTTLASERVHKYRANDLIEAGFDPDNTRALLNSQEGRQFILRAHYGLHERGIVRSNREVFDAACADVARDFGGRKAKNESIQIDVSDRQASKKSMTQPPSASSAPGRGSAPATQPGREKPSSIVAEIAKSRGQ